MCICRSVKKHTNTYVQILRQYNNLGFIFAENLSKKFGTQVNDLWDSFGTDFTYPGNLPSYMEEYFEEQQLEGKLQDFMSSKIKCLPLPGERRSAFCKIKTGSSA